MSTTLRRSHRSPDTFTTSDGTELRVYEAGTPEAGVTVVLLHGWTLTRHTWDRVVRGLLDGTGPAMRILYFDLRGHGESAPATSATTTIERCADDLAELISARAPHGRLVLAGHSMGGMTLMALAERHAELVTSRVAGLGLVGTSSGGLLAPGLGLPRPAARVANVVQRWAGRWLSRSRRPHVSRWSAWMRPGLRWLLFGTRAERGDVAATAAWVAACQPVAMTGFRDAIARHERTSALATYGSVPAVVLAGLSDRLCPYRHAKRMAAELPKARLLVYGGAGHMLPLERDTEVSARLAELVRNAAEQERSA